MMVPAKQSITAVFISLCKNKKKEKAVCGGYVPYG
jgi:hypothetical protein